MTAEVQVSSGPIFLDELRCTGSELSLLDCPTGISEVGLTNCDHSQDVWVKCRGMNQILSIAIEIYCEIITQILMNVSSTMEDVNIIVLTPLGALCAAAMLGIT